MTPPVSAALSALAALPARPVPSPRTARYRRRSATCLFTDREREILGHLAAGSSIGAIAATLGVSRSTVTTFRAALREKTGCPDTAALAAWARLARGTAGASSTPRA